MEEKSNIFGNIKEIKSPYIFRKIFLFLWVTKKLDIILYNKELQNKFELNIEDYKNTSKKYKIIEENSKGKEYFIITNKIIYVGEYNNGKRNGKGKEYYYNGNIKFEGEYINGKRINGKGYDINGNEILILKNGKGEEYYNNGKL